MDIGAGTRAIVSGASRGIGEALARALAGQGATVGLLSRSAGELEALARTLPGSHRALPADVGDAPAVQAAVDGFVEAAGGLELVVANAGVAHYGAFRDQPLEHAERMTAINWLGTVHLVAAALPHLLAGGRGHVVIVSSGAGHRAFPQAAVYGATKAAQRGFGEALRHELDGTGVSVTIVYPGETTSALHDHERDRMPAWYAGGDRAASPDVLAEKVIEAVREDARAVNHPPLIRLLRVLNGLSPRTCDAVLRRLRGVSAAPRRD